ncbi:hypothetical protein TRP8649_00188 [Pelagimonas phthalicica]|uniref:Uncharacterized protein n=1 Tax=Pelagimonas phthalicica TaxID=1037362 RepID=A0A238J6W9_9RHOB|nr:hypothetical protein [Pelagimonas phthalicica]TDS95361.1 hypothetical protein CLV87_1884 [Pelagimonas phthalicica]SMX26115.1 hypothetical protein TRP8649_00188 [Pelagimonas phthalicica]
MEFEDWLYILATIGPAILILPVVGVVAFLIVTRKLPKFGAPRDIRENEHLSWRILKEAAGIASPIGNPKEALAKVYDLGRDAPRRRGRKLVFRPKAGMRYGIFPACVFLIGFTFWFSGEDAQYSFEDWLMILGVTGLSIWLSFYAWSYRLEILDHELRAMTRWFDMKTYDLARLSEAKVDDDGFEFRFDCGNSVSVPLFVEGRSTLREIIVETLRINGR